MVTYHKQHATLLTIITLSFGYPWNPGKKFTMRLVNSLSLNDCYQDDSFK